MRHSLNSEVSPVTAYSTIAKPTTADGNVKRHKVKITFSPAALKQEKKRRSNPTLNQDFHRQQKPKKIQPSSIDKEGRRIHSSKAMQQALKLNNAVN